MRRRLVDLGLTAVGAAALIGLVKALPLLAAFITYPKVWTAGEILTSADLNAEFAAVSAQVNANLDDTNISTSAAIKGSKLADAPNGVTTTKLNDLSVTAGKLAVGAAVGGTQAASTNLGISVGVPDGEQDWVVLPAVVTRGGRVLLLGSCTGQVFITGGGSGMLTVRIRRDGTLIQTANYDLQAPATSTLYPIPCPSYSDMPTAGSHVYKVTVQVTTAGTFGTDGAIAGGYQALELS